MTSLFEGISALELSESAAEAEKVQETGTDAKGKGIAAPKAVERPDSAGEFDDSTCAICLNQISASETAQPDGCEHIYCACCILHWAVYKDKPWCPQCKAPFASLLTFRTLDGQLQNYACKESICLLKRAQWFQDHLKMREQAIAEASLPAAAAAAFPEGSIIDETDYLDYARYYEEYDDDEEVEDFYFSPAAGRARVVIGNRRHGPNGYLSAGRMQARPAPPPPHAKAKAKGAAGEGGPGSRGQPAKSERAESSSPHAPAPRSSGRKGASRAVDDDADSPGSSGRGSKQNAGRRARRNQRRAAADAKAGM